MAVNITTYNVGTGNAVFVGPAGGQTSVTVKVSAGDTIYYRASLPVSSGTNDGNVTSGNSVTLTVPSWIISAGSSAITQTAYDGGGDTEAIFTGWKTIKSVSGYTLAGATAAGTYIATGPLATFVAAAGTATGQGAFYLDPALYQSGPSSHTPKIRVRGACITNAVAPACTTIGYSLLPVATTGGGSGAVPTIATVGSATVTASFATPNATTTTNAYSSSAAFPAAGLYCLGLVIGTGGTAANANTVHDFELQVQQTAP